MARSLTLLFAAVLALVASSPLGAGKDAPAKTGQRGTDLYGDALPPGAVVRLWDSTTGPEPRQVGGHRTVVTCVALAPDCKTALSGDRGGTIRVWDVRTRKEVRVYGGHKRAIEALAVSPDGRIMASAAGTDDVHLVEIRTGKVLHRLDCTNDPRYSEEARALDFTPDGKGVFVGTRRNAILLFDVASGKRMRRFPGALNFSTPHAFAPSGGVVVSAGFLGMGSLRKYVLFLRSLSTGQELARIQAAPTDAQEVSEWFDSLALSADGKTLAARRYLDTRHGSFGYQLRVWEAASLQEILRVEAEEEINALALSADGRVVVAAFNRRDGAEPVLRLWDLSTGTEARKVRSHLSEVETLAFSRDGKTLVSGSKDGTVLVWDTASLFGRSKPAGQAPTPQDLPAYWAKLNGNHAAAARRAGWAFSRLPGPAVAFLRERLSPVRAVEADKLARLIASLDSDRFKEREKARGALAELEELAVPALRKALARPISLELRRRLEQLLEEAAKPALSGSRLRAVRVTAVLEHIGTPEARQLLEKLATGAPEARLTREARASLRRLAPRPLP